MYPSVITPLVDVGLIPGKMLSMGYGFVQFQTAEEAQKALRQLQVCSCFLCDSLLAFLSGSWLMCVFCLNHPPALFCGRSPVRAEGFRESHKVKCAPARGLMNFECGEE